jgi:hypothetical protein
MFDRSFSIHHFNWLIEVINASLMPLNQGFRFLTAKLNVFFYYTVTYLSGWGSNFTLGVIVKGWSTKIHIIELSRETERLCFGLDNQWFFAPFFYLILSPKLLLLRCITVVFNTLLKMFSHLFQLFNLGLNCCFVWLRVLLHFNNY